jgi:hypothetical protein
MHIPLLQVWPAAHWLPQLPQFCASVCRFLHWLLHGVWPPEQVHVPPEHVPPTQVVPQAPQLVLLVCRLTQTPLHAFCPLGQLQLPPEQTRPPWQTLPQLPQLLRSVLVLTHWLPQG